MGGALVYTFCGGLFAAPEVPINALSIIESVPIPEYTRLHECAAIALQSWRKIAILDYTKKTSKLTGFSKFLKTFYGRLEQFENGSTVKAILCRDSESRGDNLVFGVIRYLIISFKQKGTMNDQRELIKKLRALGREHSRIEVNDILLYAFGNALLLAIGDRLEDKKTNNIMNCWAMVLAYILFHMTSEKVSFVSVTSRQEFSQSRVSDEHNNNNNCNPISASQAINSDCFEHSLLIEEF